MGSVPAHTRSELGSGVHESDYSPTGGEGVVRTVTFFCDGFVVGVERSRLLVDKFVVGVERFWLPALLVYEMLVYEILFL